MPVPVILNPAARSSRARGLEKRIRALEPAPEVHLTRATGDAKRMARELAEQGHPVVVAAGGDGTVNEVIQGIAAFNSGLADRSKHVSLGVMPAGTMNVFARELGLPVSDLADCWRHIHSGARKGVDLWTANDLYFVQLAGVGMDAEVVEETSSVMKRRFGPLAYAFKALRVLMRRAPMLTVHAKGCEPLCGEIVLVGSGRFYGGPVSIFPAARLDDGLLDICVIRRRGVCELLWFFKSIIFGESDAVCGIARLQSAQFCIKAEQRVPFEIDGELGGAAPVEFKAAPFPLTVAV